jgi:hypothetical protein
LKNTANGQDSNERRLFLLFLLLADIHDDEVTWRSRRRRSQIMMALIQILSKLLSSTYLYTIIVANDSIASSSEFVSITNVLL